MNALTRLLVFLSLWYVAYILLALLFTCAGFPVPPFG